MPDDAHLPPGGVENSVDGDVTGSVVQAGGITGGVHIGDINLRTGAPVRTRYREQVKQIAPKELVNRDAERAELAAFATDPACAGSYALWRAPAWAGKSALLSWFVLHPPARVRVVSFFITARMSSQNDRAAFVENVLEQLATLLEDALPALLTVHTREAHMLGLLAEAAHVCEERGESLVLVVDGLDEDRGVTTGPDAHSIAALLPAELPPGLRVVVSSRPQPPIPPDVPEHHPLRDAGIARTLATSAKATAIRAEMERELKELLTGTEIQQDLLGLVAAAGGGLSPRDLSELTGKSQWEVDDHLRTVTGRSFTLRDAHRQPDAVVYVLGHEELQTAAITMLGATRIEGYRDRLHRMYLRYREAGWPPSSPEYLMSGYFNMLKAVGDLPRMITCCTDLARHNRMLDISGGDVAAIAEIVSTQETIADGGLLGTAAVAAMARLAVHRDHLRKRNSYIPRELPAVWAALGHVNRAEALAQSITSPYWRRRAQVALVEALVTTGELDRAELVAHSIANAVEKHESLVIVVEALAGAGAHDRARAITGLITDLIGRSRALCAVARAIAEAGDIDQAEACARSINNRLWLVRALTAIAEAAADHGEGERARGLASEAVSASRTLSRADVEGAAKKALSKALIVVGQDDESRVPAKPIRSKPVDPKPAPDSGGRSAYDGVPVDQVDNCEQLVLLAREAIARGDRDRARDAATEAEILARKISNPVGDGQALVTLIKAAVAVDELDRLLAVAELITGHYERVQALTALMNAVADEDLARARAIGATAEAHARLAVSEIEQKQALLALVRAVVPIGDLGWAEALTESIPVSDEHTEALYLLTEALTAKGNPDRAVQLAHTVPEPGERCRVLIGIAWSMMRAGDRSAARELVARVTTIASTISQVGKRFQTLVKLIGMTAATDGPGHVDRLITEAEALIDLVDETTWERSRLIQTVAMAEGLARAETLAGSIADPHRRHVALTELRGDPPTKPVDERPALQAEPSRRDILIAEGFFDQAAQLIRAIPDPDSQCVAWVAWARHAGPAYCTEAIVAILNQQRWPKATGLIAEYEPAVLAVLVDELLAIATPTPKSPA
ncbi:NACHT domain-containing protein [Saccharothrix luteola]|uniref:NACHT domain-containing protein n=1 Tax=Saccharothrix luteola TaxID=2893018 RepID=UPI001E4A3005|nr:NACHT domain-containing protein [Saccharothrix luteola]MCC8246636.1 NACHT domain-containing protein [Saccharothrix luteola]